MAAAKQIQDPPLLMKTKLVKSSRELSNTPTYFLLFLDTLQNVPDTKHNQNPCQTGVKALLRLTKTPRPFEITMQSILNYYNKIMHKTFTESK